MHPVLFQWGGFALPSYGMAVALGLTLASVMVVRRGKRAGWPPADLADLLFGLVMGGLLGARAAFVLVHAGTFVAACRASTMGCLAPLRIHDGGLVFQGGFVVAALWGFRFARKRGWSLRTLGDVCAPAVALGQAVGRLGCFAAGCCFGRPWEHGVSFPIGSVAYDELMRAGRLPAGAASTMPLVPVQLIDAAVNFLVGIGLLLLERRSGRTHGTLLAVYLVAAGAARFALEFLRGDDAARGFLGPLSTAMVVSLVLLTAGVVLLRRSSQTPSSQ